MLVIAPMRRGHGPGAQLPLSAIAATRGLPWLIALGSICVDFQDLLLALLPVLRVERGISPTMIGVILSIRAAAAMVSRVLFSLAVRRYGRMSVTVGASLAGGIGLVAASLPVLVWALASGLALTGFGVGMALSLRLTANRIAQFVIPFFAGIVIAPLGAAGILTVAGGALICVAASAPRKIEALTSKPGS